MIRARWIHASHNILGFTAGIGGSELLSSLKQQSSLYGCCAKVTAVTMEGEVFDVAADAPERFYSRYVLLATGVKDHLPALPGGSEAATRSLLRLCRRRGPMLRSEPAAYNLDKLFRGGAPGTTSTAGEPQSRGSDLRMEAMHIAVSAVSSCNISHENRTYLVSLVVSKVGIPTDEARKRVDAFVQSVPDATVKAVMLARSSAPPKIHAGN